MSVLETIGCFIKRCRFPTQLRFSFKFLQNAHYPYSRVKCRQTRWSELMKNSEPSGLPLLKYLVVNSKMHYKNYKDTHALYALPTALKANLFFLSENSVLLSIATTGFRHNCSTKLLAQTLLLILVEPQDSQHKLTNWLALTLKRKAILRVSCQKCPNHHAYAWQIGPFWQDTHDIQAEPWWRASIWRSHRKVVVKQCSYHNNIIDIQNRLPYSKVVYPAIIVLFSCLMEVNHGVRTGPDYPFR